MRLFVKAKAEIRHKSCSDIIESEQIVEVVRVNCKDNSVELKVDNKPNFEVSIEIYNTFFEEVEK